jgi:acyl-CoA reductase-like NAD-dependent aldehyde dehydrogenase
VIRNLNPATLEPLPEVPEDTAASAAEKVAKARAAQPAWAETPYEVRQGVVARFKALLVRERDRLARTLSEEMGKPLKQAQNELDATPARLDFFLAHTEQVLADQERLEGRRRGRDRGADPLGAARRRREHLGLELPVLRGHERVRPRAPHRQHGAL